MQDQQFPVHKEYIVIGAGPGGLQAAYFLAEEGCNYLVLEKGPSAGTFFRQFPRHEKLLSINKVHTGYEPGEINLRWDWNSLISHDGKLLFKNYSTRYFPSSQDMVHYLCDFQSTLQLQVRSDTEVVRVAKEGTAFILTDQRGRLYSCDVLIVATGLTAYKPDIKGIEYAETYEDMSLDPRDFEKQRVLIVGKGNSAFETANHLIESARLIHLVSPTPLRMAWRSKFVGHLRAVNMAFLDTYQLKGQNALLDAEVVSIEKKGGEYVVEFTYMHADREAEALSYDRVIACTGFRFEANIFDDECRPELMINNRLPALTNEWESTNVRDLYFVGTLMQTLDFKKKQSSFVHGFRHNIQSFVRILMSKRRQGDPTLWEPCVTSADALANLLIRRANESAALWHQTGFLADFIIVDGAAARYYKDLPLCFAETAEFACEECCFSMTLEFGLDVIEKYQNTFAVDRVHKDDYKNAHLSSAIHPIIRKYERGRCVSEHHVIEDLASEWRKEVHVRPLREYLERSIDQDRSKPAQLNDEGPLSAATSIPSRR